MPGDGFYPVSRADEVNPPQQVEGVGPPMEWEGESGLVLMVPGAEPIVRELRYRFDPAAAAGVGAHITVLYPFVPLDSLDGGVEQAVALVAAGHGAFDLELTAVRAWPDVVYLSIKPEAPVRALTGAMAARWPDHPPYGGAFDDIVPHLTIGHGGEDLLAEAEAAVSPHLPVKARITEVSLVVLEGDR